MKCTKLLSAFILSLLPLASYVVADPLHYSKTLLAEAQHEQENLSLFALAFQGVLSGDAASVDIYFSDNYIQHSPFVPNGRDVIKQYFIYNRPANAIFEQSMTIADGDYIIDYRRFSSVLTPEPAIAVDVFRIEDGVIAEHWDVIEDEKLPEETVSGNGMYPVEASSSTYVLDYFLTERQKTIFHEAMEKHNELIVRRALNALYINANPAAIPLFWARNLIQHNPRIANGRDALIDYYIYNRPKDFAFEPDFIAADGEFVAARSRFFGYGPNPVIIFQIFRMRNGKIVEQWEVTQEEVPASESVSGNGMFPIL